MKKAVFGQMLDERKFSVEDNENRDVSVSDASAGGLMLWKQINKNIKFPRGNYQSTEPRQKHSIN